MNATRSYTPAGRWLAGAISAAALTAMLFVPVTPVAASTTDAAVVRQGAEPQTSVGGGVTVKVTRLDIPDAVAFTVTLDTHSVNLDAYDLVRLAVVVAPSGEEVAPLAWEAPSGGHHREGTLLFPSATADGSPVLQPGIAAVVLVIRDVAGVAERAFRWES